MTVRHRRPIAWLCAVAMLVLGLAVQHHGLSHALQAVQASAQGDPPADHSRACEQCLKFTAFNGALATHVALPLLHGSAEDFAKPAFAPARRAESFTAYASRAPPEAV